MWKSSHNNLEGMFFTFLAKFEYENKHVCLGRDVNNDG